MQNQFKSRPVVAVMGHIDHGKSSLLDFIRKTNITEGEVGGITQHLSAYQIEKETPDGKRFITFIDTPGHAAFQAMRERGASVADIAILVVSAEDGVKPQTLEALKAIKDGKTPYVVAINKIDKPNADIDKTKANLAENEIYIEGYGGNIPFTPISAKVGTGIPELLETILLLADTEGMKSDPEGPAEGVVIESHLDGKRGNAATLIVKKGTLETGGFVVAGKAYAPLRVVENFLGEKIKSASAGDPVAVTGWSELPVVGSTFSLVENKKAAEALTLERRNLDKKPTGKEISSDQRFLVPIIVKADTAGTLEAVLQEVKKCETERAGFRIVLKDAGPISENDVKMLSGADKGLIVGFGVKADAKGKDLAERNGVSIATFDIIYKLTEWLLEEVSRRTPKVTTEEVRGKARILKVFSVSKDRQVIGGKVTEGRIGVGDKIRVLRRGTEIVRGKIVGLEQQRAKIGEVMEGSECGILAEAKLPIAPGDDLECLVMVEK